VANLVGAIAARQDLFRNKQTPLLLIADRSVEIASYIFDTIVDEFGGGLPRKHGTHRALAQSALKAASSFFGYPAADLIDVVLINGGTRIAVRSVLEGYGVDQHIDDRKLFHSIGFHLGSEMLADQEFRILNDFLRSEYPELIRYMERRKALNGHVESAYFWIRVHTRIEAIHFSSAMKAANVALQCYGGSRSLAHTRRWILKGVEKFAKVQSSFMRSLGDD